MLQLQFNFFTTTLRPTKSEVASQNLEDIVARFNKNYFDSSLELSIRWSRKVKSRRRRHLRLGSYYFKDKTIRIHPVLGLTWVPIEVLEAVVFHEMCHAAIPSEKISHQLRRHHGLRFKQKEQSFTHYLFAKEWISKNLHRLLKARL